MTLIRVDTYPDYLASVELRDASSPYALIVTLSGSNLSQVAPGSYTVNVGTRTGQWMLTLFDSNSESLGTYYASDVFIQAADYPPWLDSQPVYGPLSLQLNLIDDNSDPVPAVTVRVTKGSQSIQRESNDDGEVLFAVSAGTWDILINELGYTYTTTQVVVTVDTVEDVVLTPVPTITPTHPALCAVVFNVWGDEAPLEGAKIVARIENVNEITDEYLVSQTIHRGVTDEQGQCTLQLIKQNQFSSGGVYLIEAFNSRNEKLYSKRVTVPNQTSINATELVSVG